MKIQIDLHEIQDAIKKVGKVAPKKLDAIKKVGKVAPKKLDAAAAGAQVKLTAGDDVTLEATNSETAIKVTVNASVTYQGTVLLPQDILKLIAQSKSEGVVTITDTEITIGKSVIKYYGLGWNEFPMLDYGCDTFGFTATQKELLDMLSVKYAAAIDGRKPVFNSVLIEKNHTVATDTHRLAQRLIPVENKLEKVLVPIAAVNLLCGLLNKKHAENVTCSVSNAKVSFSFGNIVLVSRQINAKYPNWRATIPRDFATTLKVDAVNVLAELKGLESIAKSCRVVGLAAENDTLYVTVGEYENSVKLQFPVVITGDEQGKQVEKTAVDYFYFCDILKAHWDREIEIKFNGSCSPIAISGDIVLPIWILA